MSAFSAQWFTAFYITLGTLLVSFGLYLIARHYKMAKRLLEASKKPEPPYAFKSSLRYLLFFTLPGVVLSFFPFSWIELLFSVWLLFIIFTLGSLLVQWKGVSQQILNNAGTVHKKIRLAGMNMVSIGIVLFMLCYLLISRQ